MVNLREKLAAKDAAIELAVQDLRAVIRPYFWSSVENFRVDINRCVSDAFRLGSIYAQYHADTAINGTTIHPPSGAAWEEGKEPTKEADVVDAACEADVIELR